MGIEFLVLCVAAAIAFVMAWVLYCNDKTCSQRLALIHVVFHESDGSWSRDRDTYDYLFRAVTYEQHYRALLLLRDPFGLYDKRLRDRLEAQGGKSDG